MCSGLRPPQYALPTPEVSPLEAAPRSLADYHAHYATHVSHAPTLALSGALCTTLARSVVREVWGRRRRGWVGGKRSRNGHRVW